ncbi:MAG: sigma 54-interacting transcriptional regulator [Peptostreptococcaceae bacterium]|nr:sigma 54-interacting transcriptional regulator [Peptostreptococcaceae bacterium]
MFEINGMKIPDIDNIMVVSKDYKILYNSRYDERLNKNEPFFNMPGDTNNDLFTVYPNLKRNNCTIVKAMTEGKMVNKKFQRFQDKDGNLYCTHNITIPLYNDGAVVGCVEVYKNLTNSENADPDFMDEKEEEKQETEDILTVNMQMKKCIKLVTTLAEKGNHILIYGETGTGKELFAQAAIKMSGAPENKRIVQNCAAIPENLMESILFGASKGAYTGAENHRGLFEEADGGILFLDELNSLPYHVQGKLLRVLQDGTFRAVGGNKEKKVNAKVVATINIDPMKAIEEKILRPDLFYRLSAGLVYVPPLRDRKEDIEYLSRHFLEEYTGIYDKHIAGFNNALMNMMMNYSWEGNVRELKHTIESMVIAGNEGYLDIEEMPKYILDKIKKPEKEEKSIPEEHSEEDSIKMEFNRNLENDDNDLKHLLDSVEYDIIINTIKKTGGNVTKAAKVLGLTRQTMKYKIDKYEKQK